VLALFQPPQVRERGVPAKKIVKKKRPLAKTKIVPMHTAPTALGQSKPQPSTVEIAPERESRPVNEQ